MRRRLALSVVLSAGGVAACSLVFAPGSGLTGGSDDGGGPDAPAADGALADVDAGETGCDASFATDSKNCGRCGRDCFGGDCVAGQCRPVLLADGPKSQYIAIDDTYLYMADVVQSRVMRVAKHGGVVETMATGQGQLYEIAVDDAYLYFSNGYDTRRMPKGGGDPVTIVTGRGDNIAVDDRYLYVTNYTVDATGVVRRFDKDGTNEVTLASGLTTSEMMAPSGGYLFFSESGIDGNASIYRVDREGGDVKTLLRASARRIAVDAANVVWVGLISPDVSSYDLDGGLSRVLGSSPGNVGIGDVALDESSVYWACEDNEHDGGSVQRVSRRGGEVEQIAALRGVSSVAVDDAAIYWSSAVAGRVYLRAK